MATSSTKLACKFPRPILTTSRCNHRTNTHVQYPMAHHPPPHLPDLQERHRPLPRSQRRQLFLRLSLDFSARATRDPRPFPRRRRRRRPRASRSPHKRRSKRSRSRYQQGHGGRGGFGEREGSLIDRLGIERCSARHIGIFSVHSTACAFVLTLFSSLFLFCRCFGDWLGFWDWERVDRGFWATRGYHDTMGRTHTS